MKTGIHPKYEFVIFHDTAAEHSFLTRSTIKSEKTMKWEDGKEYPVVNIEISNVSHPFYTGKQRLLDTAGRVERFKKRFAKTEGKVVERKAKKTKAVAKVSKRTKKILSNVPRVEAPAKKAKVAKKEKAAPKK